MSAIWRDNVLIIHILNITAEEKADPVTSRPTEKKRRRKWILDEPGSEHTLRRGEREEVHGGSPEEGNRCH